MKENFKPIVIPDDIKVDNIVLYKDGDNIREFKIIKVHSQNGYIDMREIGGNNPGKIFTNEPTHIFYGVRLVPVLNWKEKIEGKKNETY